MRSRSEGEPGRGKVINFIRKPLIIAAELLVVAVAVMVSTEIDNNERLQRITDYVNRKPTILSENSTRIGGIWINPVEPKIDVNPNTTLVIKAKPSVGAGDPPIKDVVFTANYPDQKNPNGAWHIIDVATQHNPRGVYEVSFDLKFLKLPSGTIIKISFDVENTAKEQKLAPQGVHELVDVVQTPKPPSGSEN